jgi:hypothetical protein
VDVLSDDYVPRDACHTVLHRVVLDHVETFFAAARRADGTGLPGFVEREFREFLTCGVLAGGGWLSGRRTWLITSSPTCPCGSGC